MKKERLNVVEMKRLEDARQIFAEHFEAGILLVCNSEGGVTRSGAVEWGNAYAVEKLGENYTTDSLHDEEEADDDGDDDDSGLPPDVWAKGQE